MTITMVTNLQQIYQISSREHGCRQAIGECKSFLLNLFPNIIVGDSQVGNHGEMWDHMIQ